VSEATRRSTGWWGEFRFAAGETTTWCIGPLRLAMRRARHEWQLGYGWVEVTDAEVVCSVATTTDPLPAYENQERYVFRETGEALQIRPALADRPVISRPVTPFHLPAGEEATLFVSSPVWLHLSVPEPACDLTEVPIQRSSDTWFGPSTREGQLCYDSRTAGRLHLEEVPKRPHRAVTRVVIRNEGSDALRLERLSLPAPYLAVFEADDGLLWTTPVTLVRDHTGEMGMVKIHERPPQEARGAKRLSPPREKPTQGSLVRALSALFG
jgi:hypothetical protein